MSTKKHTVENLKIKEILQAINKTSSQNGYSSHNDKGSFHYIEIVSDSDNIDTLIWGLFNNNKPTLVRFVNHTQITILKDNNKFGDELICDRLDEETIHKYTQEIHDIKNVIILFDFMKTMR